MQNFHLLHNTMRSALSTLFTISILLSYSQERCGTKPSNEPQPFENWLSNKISKKAEEIRLGIRSNQSTVYQVPVVVHIVEPAEGENLNITNERIIEQMEILNDDFRRTNEDAINTPSVFLPVAADTEIEFHLAKQDPSGNPTNGIVRVNGNRSSYNPLIASHKSSLRTTSYWPPSHYLNIYVTNLSGFLGYSSFPTISLAGLGIDEEDFLFDAVYVDRQYFGVNPDAPSFASFGRTTTHEVGHYLGLRHIWGDGNCSADDFVADTPVADNNNDGLGSPCTFPNLDDNVVCTPGEDEMFQNYMDYTNDLCMNLFTTGQKTRMRTVMENAPRRASLLTSPGLVAPTRFENDLAIKKINSPFRAICSDQIVPEVEVINYSLEEITSYDVSLVVNGDTIETINQTSALDTFEVETIPFTPQTILSAPTTVEFVISNVNSDVDGNTSNNSRSITLSNIHSILTPFTESFESTNQLLGEFGPSHPWEVVSAPSENPINQALAFKAYNNTSAFDEDVIFKTPIINLEGIVSAGLIFRYAYASVPDGFRDGLAIKISRDCGATFPDVIYLDYGDDLETATETSALFVPSGELEWQTDTISLVEAENNANIDGIQLAFIGLNGGGNNIYLDDVSVRQIEKEANDASLIDIRASTLTCNDVTTINFDVRNVGFEIIESMTIAYQINDSSATQVLSNEIGIDLIKEFSIGVPIEEGDNNLTITITQVNDTLDIGPTRNSLSYVVNRDNSKDQYPLVADFETPNSWTIRPATNTPIWRHDTVLTSQNIVLNANGFEQTQKGIEDWLISPELLMSDLDTAGITFKVAHAKRAGFNDRLRLLVSTDCGENYDISSPLFDAVSDSLATVESDTSWEPTSESHWQEFKVDLKRYVPFSGVRLAFVFTNDNGNNLFLDDINIGYKPELTEEKLNRFSLFPNPASSVVNIAFNLSERQNIELFVFDVSGRLVYAEEMRNVIDQVYDLRVPEKFQVPSQGGFYFVKVVGNNINQVERLYIRR